MEAARLRDESAGPATFKRGGFEGAPDFGLTSTDAPSPTEACVVRLEEVLLSSADGEVNGNANRSSGAYLSSNRCKPRRVRPVGRFHRASMEIGTSRAVIQIQPAFRLLVRTCWPMSQALANLVSSRLPIVGLAAYSMHVSERVLVSDCLSKSLYRSVTEQMLGGPRPHRSSAPASRPSPSALLLGFRVPPRLRRRPRRRHLPGINGREPTGRTVGSDSETAAGFFRAAQSLNHSFVRSAFVAPDLAGGHSLAACSPAPYSPEPKSAKIRTGFLVEIAQPLLIQS